MHGHQRLHVGKRDAQVVFVDCLHGNLARPDLAEDAVLVLLHDETSFFVAHDDTRRRASLTVAFVLPIYLLGNAKLPHQVDGEHKSAAESEEADDGNAEHPRLHVRLTN